MSVALNVIEQHQRSGVFRSGRNKILQELVYKEQKSIRLLNVICNHGRRFWPLPQRFLKCRKVSVREFLKMTDGEWVCLRPVAAGKKDLEEGKATCCALHWRLGKLALGRAAASTFTDSRPPIPSRQCGNGASVRA